MLWKRVVTALIGIPALILAAYMGSLVFLLVVLVLGLLGLYEYRNIIQKAGYRDLPLVLWVGGLGFPFLFYYGSQIFAPFMIIFLFCSYTYYLIFYPRYTPADLALNLLGVVYVVTGFSHFLLLRSLDNGFWLVLFTFLVVWSTDTGAYFSGIYLGKRKLAAKISPHKTWAGFWGGLLATLLMTFILGRTIPGIFTSSFLVIAPLISLAGQLGDLFESALKRFARVKDSGRIIPGHGGLLDRFDSSLWAVPLTYYLVVIIERLN